MASSDELDFARTGPGTLAGRYLRMFWQPVYRAEDLAKGRAVPIRIMCEDFTLYRGESGTPYLSAFRCAHRGTQLSTGWVEGDAIRCRYHGWKYDGTGRCVEQPGEEENFSSKACLSPGDGRQVKIRSYPAKEYLGLIFAYLGEGEPPPFRRYPQLESPGIAELYTPEYWPCNYFNRIDNACDVAHISFAHKRSRVAVNQLREVPTLTAEETEYGVRTNVTRGTTEVSSLHFLMPNTNHFRTSLALRDPGGGDRGQLDRFLWRIPVDDDKCVSFPVDFAHLTGAEAEEYRERRRKAKLATPASHTELGESVLQGKITMEAIENQPNLKNLTSLEDYVVQVGQGPNAPREEDRLGKQDVGVFLVRKIWQRELKALAEGRPLKPWVIPERITDKVLK